MSACLSGSSTTDKQQPSSSSSRGAGATDKSFSARRQQRLASGSPQAQQYWTSEAGQSVLQAVGDNPLVRLVDGTQQIVTKGARQTLKQLASPLAHAAQAASNLTQVVAQDAANVAIKGFVTGVSTMTPAIKLGVDINNNVLQPIRNLANTATANMAATTQSLLQENQMKIQQLNQQATDTQSAQMG